MHRLHFLLLFFALSAVAFVGCDSNDDENDYSDILGRWEALDSDVEEDIYLNITDDEIVGHFFELTFECFFRETYDVVGREGQTWTIRVFSENEDVIFRRDGDDLITESPDIEDGDIVRFERSTRTDFTPPCD